MKNNGLISLLVVLAFSLGRFAANSTTDTVRSTWMEIPIFFLLWFLTAVFLEAMNSAAMEKKVQAKEEKVDLPDLRAE